MLNKALKNYFSTKWIDVNPMLNTAVNSIERVQNMLDMLKQVYMPEIVGKRKPNWTILKTFASEAIHFHFNGQIVLFDSERQLLLQKLMEVKSIVSDLIKTAKSDSDNKTNVNASQLELIQTEIEQLFTSTLFSLEEQGM